MSEFSDLFFSSHEPVTKRTFTCSDHDYELVKHVFPEYGFLQYFPGLFFKLLAEELRKRKIKNALDRLRYSDIATVPGMLSNLDITFNSARQRDVRFGVGKVRNQPAHLHRILADLDEGCSWKCNEDEKREAHSGEG